MPKATPEKLNSATRSHFAIGGLDTSSQVLEMTATNDLYKTESRPKQQRFFFPDDIEAFSDAYYVSRPTQGRIYAALKPIVDRVTSATAEEQKLFRVKLGKYVDLYAYVGQTISFTGTELKQLFRFCRYLLRIIPVSPEDHPREVKRYVEVDTIKPQKNEVNICPEKEKGTLQVHEEGAGGPPLGPPLPEPLSKILKCLNERFGTDITGPAAEEFIEHSSKSSTPTPA